MNRRTFITSISAVGAALVLPFKVTGKPKRELITNGPQPSYVPLFSSVEVECPVCHRRFRYPYVKGDREVTYIIKQFCRNCSNTSEIPVTVKTGSLTAYRNK